MGLVEDLIQLAGVPGLGRARYRRIVEQFGSWEKAVRASVNELMQVQGLTAEMARAIRSVRDTNVTGEIEGAQRLGVRLVPYTDPGYPANLKLLEDAPLLLYVRGTIEETDRLAIAIVGSRHCSYYGLSQAERLSYGLARAGFCIVSGLARGIDTAAHRAALKANGRTIAVVGSGLGNIYPPEHSELAEEITQHGALVSEFPLSTPPRPQNFPPRNRIISGLSLGVVVVEAGARSGALITARWALETGKEVYAVPGQVNDPRSRGCHALIKDGAKLVESLEDIVEELGPLAESIELPQEVSESTPVPALSDRERKLYAAIAHAPQTVDEIARAAELPIPAALVGLLALEMKGLVKQLAGKRFVKR